MTQWKTRLRWAAIGLCVIVFFLSFFMSSTSSSNRSRGQQGISALESSPRPIGIADLLLIVAIGAAFLATFHRSYGGWWPRYRWYYQLGIILLIYFAALSLMDILGGTSGLAMLFLFGMIFVWACYNFTIALLIRQKRYALAHHILDAAQRFAPKNANLYITRAWVHQSQKEYEKAIQSTSQALDLTPRFKKKEEGWFSFNDWRLIMGHNLRMVNYFTLAQHDMALDDAEILVRIHPTSPIHYVNRSLAFRKRGEFEAAQADLDTASQLKLQPFEKAFLLYSRGHLAVVQHQYAVTRDFYQQALALPLLTKAQQQLFYPEVCKEIGLLEMREGHDAEAEEEFRKAKAINPNYAIIGLALLYAQRGEWAQAVAEWKRLITLQPNYSHLEIMRRHHESDPSFVTLIEQIFARLDLDTISEPSVQSAHPLMAS
jgi:tetratricopeptide (TPR) repeat protein